MLSVANFIINWPLNNLNINRHRINRRIGLRDDFNLVVRPLIDFRASNRNKKLQKVWLISRRLTWRLILMGATGFNLGILKRLHFCQNFDTKIPVLTTPAHWQLCITRVHRTPNLVAKPRCRFSKFSFSIQIREACKTFFQQVKF